MLLYSSLLCGLLSLLSITRVSGLNVVSHPDHYYQSEAYDKGVYGEVPTKGFRTFNKLSPVTNILQYNPVCDDGKYIMLAQRARGVRFPGPVILNANGSLVWTNDQYRQPYNLQVQKYKGDNYLTFWAGNDGVVGHGSGTYYMLDKHYQEAFVFKALNGLDGDLHEFAITEEGTALISIYHIIEADLTSVGGPERGYVWDGVFQEINLETMELVFEWRASEHYEFTESYREHNSEGRSHRNAWDYFHLNSVEKDPEGNYLVSSRYMHTLTKVNGTNGDVIWKLGGRKNMFEDLSDGAATGFKWQHHARWRDDYTALTVFDNESQGSQTAVAPSRGLYIAIDQANMTAEVRATYFNPGMIISQSQGSVQFLDNGNVFVGFGHNAAYTTFTKEGDVLCDVHFGAGSKFGAGGIESYRAMKFDWVGLPLDDPSVALYKDRLYVSWNGATEVFAWILEGTSSKEAAEAGEFSFIKAVPKSSFESSTELDDNSHKFVRFLAVDKDGQTIGQTDLVDTGMAEVLDDSEMMPISILPAGSMPFVVLLGILGFAALCTWVYELFRCIGNNRKQRRQPFEKVPIDEEDAAMFSIGHEDDDAEETLVTEESHELLPKKEHSSS